MSHATSTHINHSGSKTRCFKPGNYEIVKKKLLPRDASDFKRDSISSIFCVASLTSG